MAAPHLSAALVGELTRLKGRPAAHIALTDAKVETPLGPRPLPPCVQAVAAVEWPAGQVLTTKDGDEWEVRLPAAVEVEAGVFGGEPERAWYAIGVFEYGGRWLVDLDEAAATDDPLVAFEGGGFGRGSFWAKPLSQRLTWLKVKRPPAKRYYFGRDCVSGDVDAVKAHIAAGASLGPAKSGDPTPLHLAAMASRSPEVVRLLVEAGADLEARVDKEPKSLRVYGDRDRFPRLHLLQSATPLVVAIGALASRTAETVAAVEWPAGQLLTTKDGDEWEVRVPAAPEVEAGVFGDEPERAWYAIRVFEHGGRWLVDLDEAAATDDPLVAFEGGGFGRGSFWAKPLSQRLTWLK
ncbi:MAG TPA: hypothetical protein VGF17_00035, partial [Phytomonospora sp.]